MNVRSKELIRVRIFKVSHYVDIEVVGAKDEEGAHEQAISLFNEESPRMKAVEKPTIVALTMKDDDLPAGEVIH